MNIQILIAAHKPYWMPQDPSYLPLHVGAAGKADLGFTRDDTGPNISGKNPHFCELTGLYWAWKNLDADYIGLVHYGMKSISDLERTSKKPLDFVMEI